MSSQKKEKKSKPQYNVLQNTAWMVRLAWEEKEKKVLVLSLFIALFSVAVNLLNLYVVPTILAAVESKAPLGELLGTILFFAAALMFCNAVTTYLSENVFFGRVTLRGAILSRLVTKHLTTSYANLNDEKYLNSFNKASSSCGNNYEATEIIWTRLTTLLKNILGFLLYLLLLTAVNPLLFALILVTSVISYFLSKYTDSYYRTHSEEHRKLHSRRFYVESRRTDTVSAKDIRIFGLRPWLEELYRKSMTAYEAFYRRAETRVFWGAVVDLFFTFLRNAVAYAYLIGLVLSGGLNTAEFLLYFSAVSGFADWITGFISEFSLLRRESLDLSVVRETLEYPECFTFEEGEELIPDNTKKYELCLENVTFQYPGTDSPILKNISFTLHPGEKIAVVGLNGAGKTTLVKLVCGLLDPTAGRVLLDGQDIRQYNRRDYYKLFSSVFQEFLVLPATIAANVAQSETDIDLERVKSCIEKAGLTAKVESESKGYDTLLNHDVYDDAIELSGGETQRLMLARALYKDAPFIILDEPTAALDPIAESEMYNKYHDMTRDRSSIYISHRLASTRFCDRILFIENGILAEEGTHDTLLSHGGRYAELFNVQSEYYKEGGNDDGEQNR